jgi:hypothetical protein
MLSKLYPLALLLVALVPSAYLAFELRDMPHLGFYHDDSVYWTSAKSLADGGGYRIESLPGEPYQTKYTPVYPALLAVIWKLNPNFPANLPAATLLAWSLFPPYLAMVWLTLGQLEFSGWRRQALWLASALSPVAVVFTFSVMPELLFAALFLGSILLAEKAIDRPDARWLPLVAGLLGALAYLTKSIGGPLLIAIPAGCCFRRQFRSAALYVAAMLPAPLVWQWWMSQHLSNRTDLATLYYTNYVGYQLYNVPRGDLPLVIWHNFDLLLMGIGKLLTFDVPFGSKHLERLVAAAAIAGCIRLAWRTRRLLYPAVALVMIGLMLVWHDMPDQRVVFPLYTLLAAGLWTELENVTRALRISWRMPTFADRAAAGVGAAVLASFAAFVMFTTFFGLFHFLPGLFDVYRADLEARRPAYAWIAKNTSADASFFAYDDPMVYLYTGRKSLGLPLPPKLQYHEDEAGIDRLLDSIPEFASQNGLGYALITPGDFYRDLRERGERREKAAIAREHPVFYSTGATIYELSAPRAVASAH